MKYKKPKEWTKNTRLPSEKKGEWYQARFQSPMKNSENESRFFATFTQFYKAHNEKIPVSESDKYMGNFKKAFKIDYNGEKIQVGRTKTSEAFHYGMYLPHNVGSKKYFETQLIVSGRIGSNKPCKDSLKKYGKDIIKSFSPNPNSNIKSKM